MEKTPKIDIIHEDKDFIIINKPAGLITHNDGKDNNKDSVAAQIMNIYPDIKGIGEQDDRYERSGIIHRLDADTSGVMIVARTQKFYDILKTQFQNHEVQKEYRAIVYGHFKIDKGYIKDPIGRSKSDFRKYVCGRHARGELRSAETYYEVLNQGSVQKEKLSYISVFPKTGRTHQIRVHMKHIHHGIVADKLYMPNNPDFNLKYQALHAFKIVFTDIHGKTREFESNIRQDILDLIIQIC